MKTIITILIAFTLSAQAVTPFYYIALNSDGSPNTNQVTFQPYPPSQTITIIGTNIIFGGITVTSTPNASGWFSNSLFGNGYKVTQSGQSFFAAIPETTNYTSLALYVTNSPQIGAFGGYSFITNWLGFAPAPVNPATNTITYVSAVSGITNATGNVTNLLVTLATNVITYQAK